MASSSQWNLIQTAEKLSSDERARAALIAEMERCKSLLIPAKRDEIMACLGKLILHYPQTNMGESQFRVLFEDYMDDLAEFPATVIAAACKEYRLNPEHRFFPSVGWLVSKAKDAVYLIRRQLTTIEKVLSVKPEKPKGSVTAEQWAELRRNLGAELRGAGPQERCAATVEAMRKAGAPEADIEAFMTSGVAA